MRFCQIDGAELVDDAPALDPYATIVGHKLDFIPEEPTPAEPAAVEGPTSGEEIALEPLIHETSGSVPIAEPEVALDLPGADPLKTMYVSEAELKEVFGGEKETADEPIVETPVESSEPEQPIFSMPEIPSSGFGEMAPPPSPFSAPETPFEAPPVDRSAFADAETVLDEEEYSPFNQPEPAPVAEWTPPPPPAWENQPAVSNVPAETPAFGTQEQSKGLAIGSLVCGILSCLCCLSVLTGPAAIVMGFIAKKKADESPSQFGGRGLALGGMVTGALGLLLGIVLIILQVFFGVLGNLMR